jgi:hypothetical protein
MIPIAEDYAGIGRALRERLAADARACMHCTNGWSLVGTAHPAFIECLVCHNPHRYPKPKDAPVA